MRQPAIESDSTAALPAYCPASPSVRRRRFIQPIKPNLRRRHNERGERMLTVAAWMNWSMNNGRGAKLPMIRMRGEWLERLGFAIGARIVVSEERGRLVLTIEGEE